MSLSLATRTTCSISVLFPLHIDPVFFRIVLSSLSLSLPPLSPVLRFFHFSLYTVDFNLGNFSPFRSLSLVRHLRHLSPSIGTVVSRLPLAQTASQGVSIVSKSGKGTNVPWPDPRGFIYVRLSGRMIFSTYGTSLYPDTPREFFLSSTIFAIICDLPPSPFGAENIFFFLFDSKVRRRKFELI